MDHQIANNPTTGELKLKLSKLGLQYETVLQKAEDIKFSKETLQQDFLPLKSLRELHTSIKAMENPFTASWKKWNEDRKSLFDPVDTLLTKKTGEYTTLATEIKKELADQEAEKLRIKNIKDFISSFTIEFAGKIAAADSFAALNAIHMRIGTEKSRKTFYSEFLPDFVEACKGLENALRDQKGKVKELEGLDKKAVTATDEEQLVIMDEKELVVAQIEQNKLNVQQETVNAASAPTETIVAESTFVAPKPRRTTIDWEVKDFNLLSKKNPELVVVQANVFEVDKLAKELRESKKWPKGQEEYMHNGIRFFEKYSY